MIFMIFLFGLLLVGFVGGEVLSFSACCGIRVSLLDLSLVVLLLGWFCWIWQTKYPLRRLTPLIKIFVPFLLIAIISLLLQWGTLMPVQLGISALYLVRFMLYASLVPILLSVKNIRKMSLTGLWWSGVSMAVLGLLQYALYPNLRNLAYLGWDPHEFRVFSTLLDPNFTGIILVLTLFLGLYLILKNQLPRAPIVFGFVITLLALLLTYSRGSFLSLLVGLFVWSIWYRKLLWFLIAIGVFLGILIILPRPGGEGVNLLRSMSVQSRIDNSIEALNLFRRAPVLGFGFNTLRFVRGETGNTTGTEDVSHSGAGFHNSFLFILTTTGIVGLLTYFWMWKSIAATLLKNKMQTSQMALLTASAVCVGVDSLFDNSLFFPFVLVWLWVLSGYFMGGNLHDVQA